MAVLCLALPAHVLDLNLQLAQTVFYIGDKELYNKTTGYVSV